MENEILIAISAGVVSSMLTVLVTRFTKKSIVIDNDKENQSIDLDININNTIKTKEFLDSFLEQKYRYYLTSDILAYFLNGKEIPKKEIQNIKEKFFSDVTMSLNKKQQENILKIFTSKGIELYIHQSFLKLLNESNIKFTDDTQLDKRAIQTVYDINEGAK